MDLAPIVIFTYNRLYHTQKTIEALQKNYLAKDSDIFIFSDGPKNEEVKAKILEVRRFLRTITGFKNITIIEREKNIGLAKSIIEGITEIINKYGKVIVLEDDIVTTPNFLNYMNQALDFYKDKKECFNIAGYLPPIKKNINNYQYDGFFYPRNSSWGWGIWKDRWEQIKFDISKEEYNTFCKNRKSVKEFCKAGDDVIKMLKEQISGKINTWDIQLTYSQFLHKGLTLYPVISKTQNIGFDNSGTHCKSSDANRWDVPVDNGEKTNFIFPEKIEINKKYFIEINKNYAIPLKGKIKIFLKKLIGLEKDEI